MKIDISTLLKTWNKKPVNYVYILIGLVILQLIIFIIYLLFHQPPVKTDLTEIIIAGKSKQSETKGTVPTLLDALYTGKVTAQFSGTGGSSGDAIRLTIQKSTTIGQQHLILSIPPGSMLFSSNPTEQDMIIAGIRGRQVNAQEFIPGTQIMLTDTTSVTYILEAYGVEFYKSNPTESARLILNTPDPMLASILTEGKKRKESVQTLQAAIWSVIDNIAYEQMTTKLAISMSDWKAGQTLIQTVKTQSGNTLKPTDLQFVKRAILAKMSQMPEPVIPRIQPGTPPNELI